jgi:pimeloyl-ACP methyl ester carboxylesterase
MLMSSANVQMAAPRGGHRVLGNNAEALMKVFVVALAVAMVAASANAQRLVSIPVAGTAAHIEADLYGSGERAVLLAHGGRFHKESWRAQAQELAANGFLVLAIAFRGDGFNPDGTPAALGSDEDNATDVLAGAAYLRSLHVKSLAAIGASLGGDAVGNAQARSAVFDRMVFLGSEGGSEPERLAGSKLYLVARDDVSGDGPRLPGITAHYDRAPQPKRLVVVEGKAHAQYLYETDQGPRVLREILLFLAEK